MTTLEDLRKANLKEQRSAPVPTSGNQHGQEKTESPIVADLTGHGLSMVDKNGGLLAEADAPQLTEKVSVSKEAKVSSSPRISAPVVDVQPAQSPVTDTLAEKMRAAVIRKRVIPAGVKATVDMPPELFWRAKRYCHDHSNATLRQCMLEILNLFLDDEGY